MKKATVFFLVAAALLCFAVPAIASPPGGPPALEVVSLAASVIPGYFAPEPAATVAQASDLFASERYFEIAAPVALGLLFVVLIVATAAMLAGLMRGGESSSKRLGFSLRDRLQRMPRDQTAAA